MSAFTRASLKLLLCLAAMIASAQAHAQACGTTLYGSVTLTADVVCPAGIDAFVIGDHNVRIDLNGFSIIGPQNHNFAAGVRSSGFDGVQIVGPGSITGFYFPIEIDGGDKHLLSAITVGPDAGYSVSIRNSSGSVIELSHMPFLEITSDLRHAAKGNRIVDNVLGFGGIGVSLSGCNTSDNLIAGNSINQTGMGVGLHDGANNNQVLKNRIVGGQIYLEGASNNLIEYNLIDNEGWKFVGIVLGSSPWSTSACSALPSSYNIVRGNRVRLGTFGAWLDDAIGTAPSTGNLLTGNTFAYQSEAGLFFGNALYNDARGNRYVNVPVPVYDFGVGNLWP